MLFSNMYSILFHILWLSLLEIIFYFEYIGPLETKTYKNTIRRLSKNKLDNDNDNYLINPYNTSNIININEFNSKNTQSDREKYNDKLYLKSIYYWLILFGVVVFIYLIILCHKYYIFIKNKKRNNEIEIEFSTVRNRTLTNESDDLEDIPNNLSNSEVKFINYYKLRKIIYKKTVYYLLLGILILIFEYLFFNYIIIKYKVLSDQEILYEICKLINPLLNEIFNT